MFLKRNGSACVMKIMVPKIVERDEQYLDFTKGTKKNKKKKTNNNLKTNKNKPSNRKKSIIYLIKTSGPIFVQMQGIHNLCHSVLSPSVKYATAILIP